MAVQVFANQVNGLRHKGRKDEIFSGSFVFEGSCGLYSMEGAYKDNLSLKSTNLEFIFGRVSISRVPCYWYRKEDISAAQFSLTAKRDAL